MNQSKTKIALFMDHANAFNTFDHQQLLEALADAGVRAIAFELC